MENQTTRPPLVTISTQTEDSDNIGRGREPIQPEFNPQIFPLSSISERMPDYRKHFFPTIRRRIPGGSYTHTNHLNDKIQGLGSTKKIEQVFLFATKRPRRHNLRLYAL